MIYAQKKLQRVDRNTCAISINNIIFVCEDTKEVIRIRKLKQERQHNGQKKKYKRTNIDLQNIDIKLKIE